MVDVIACIGCSHIFVVGEEKMLSSRYLIAVVSFVLVGCVDTRDPFPVALKQANDNQLTCEQIQMNYKVNTEVATQKIALNNEDDVQDVLLGGLIWPGLADFKNADGVEGNALLDRNVWLRELAVAGNCNTLAYPPQPARYD